MRICVVWAIVVAAALVAGCNRSSGPVKPAEVSEEQSRQYRDDQQKINVEESQHQQNKGVR